MKWKAISTLGLAVLAVGCTGAQESTLAPSVDRPSFSAHSSGTVTIIPTATPNLFTEGWLGYGDRTGATGLASIGTLPSSQVLGNGSLEMTNTFHGWEVAAYGSPAVAPATPLSDITALSYSTFTPSGQPGIAVQHVALQFTIDYDLNDAAENFQGRLVYEPYHCNDQNQDAWETWNTLASGNTGCWWGTSASPRVNNAVVAQGCPMTNPCTWDEFMIKYPYAGFHGTNGATGLILKVGTPWLGTFYADAIVVGVGGTTTTYDFEPWLTATTKDACKKGGWQTLFRADGSPFRNQGACVSYVNTGK